MRKVMVVVFGIISMSGLALAQVPNGNVYFGYTYYNTDLSLNRGNLNGFQGTLEGKLVPFLGIVADITGHYGSLAFPVCPVQPVGSGGGGCATENGNAHQYEVMFGPRVSFPAGKFRPFAEFEVGVGHVNTNSDSNVVFGSATSYATAVGGGLDYKIFGPVAWRVEGDYVRTHFFSAGQSNFRFSTGIAFRF
jgi:opacity protein-like surface antigen